MWQHLFVVINTAVKQILSWEKIFTFSKAEMLRHIEQGVTSQGRKKSDVPNQIIKLPLQSFNGNEMHVFNNICREMQKV